MQRAVAMATLVHGLSVIEKPSFCEDALASMNAAMGLGAEIEAGKHSVKITGGVHSPAHLLDCRESGLCMRMFAPIAALFGHEIMLTGRPSLLRRPVGFLEKPLEMLGAAAKTSGGFPPLKVKGPLKGGVAAIDASVSSQALTGLLIALPICKNDSKIKAENLQSREYVDLTVSMQKQFGVIVKNPDPYYEILGNQTYNPSRIAIEGDWSCASFMLVAGAISGEVKITGLAADSHQPDRKIVLAIERAGGSVKFNGDSVCVKHADLSGFEFDATGCPDLFPPLVALACACRGTSTIKGAGRLKHKESDRAGVLAGEFSKIGAKLKVEGDCMVIEGSKILGGTIDPHNDHRIAMAGGLAGMMSEKGVKIKNPECVSKSYPGFFEDLQKIGADV